MFVRLSEDVEIVIVMLEHYNFGLLKTNILAIVYFVLCTGVDAVKIITVLHLNEVKDNECIYFEMIITTDS